MLCLSALSNAAKLNKENTLRISAVHTLMISIHFISLDIRRQFVGSIVQRQSGYIVMICSQYWRTLINNIASKLEMYSIETQQPGHVVSNLFSWTWTPLYVISICNKLYNIFYAKFSVDKHLCPNSYLNPSMCLFNYIISLIRGCNKYLWPKCPFLSAPNHNWWLCPMITVSLILIKMGSHTEHLPWDWYLVNHGYVLILWYLWPPLTHNWKVWLYA